MPARTTSRTWTMEKAPSGDSGKCPAKKDANGGIDGGSDGGGKSRAAASSTSQLIWRNWAFSISHVGVSREKTSGASPSTSATARLPERGMVVLLRLEGGHDVAGEDPQAVEHLLLRDLLVGVEDEVDEVDARRLPLLQLAD